MKATVWLLVTALLAYPVVSELTALPSNGDLRLAGYGSTLLWGRLEIYLDGSWGTICDDMFSIREAEVACRQMGLGYAVNYRGYPLQRHGLSDSAIHLVLDCTGKESHILNCDKFQITNANYCLHDEDVEIVCSEWKPWPYSGEIRLVGGVTASEGYVEIYLNGEWGRVCSDSMSSNEANVICRQLGYDSAVSYTPSDDNSTFNIPSSVITRNMTWFNNDLNCSGNEVCFTSCLPSLPIIPVNQCSNAVGVRCAHSAARGVRVGSKSACEVNSTLRDKSLRLVGGNAPNVGRLEVLHNNEWGVICFDNFSAAEGHVACRQLGYSVIYDYANVVVNDTPIVHFYGAHCIGTESSLMACDFIELSDRMCGPSGFVSIHCYDVPYPPLASVRMLGGTGPFGVVEVFNGGRWGPICGEHFNQEDGDVMCRQLGFTGALHIVPNSYLGVVRSFLHMTNITCTGNETHLWDCPFTNTTEVKCHYHNQVAVHCGSNSSMLYGALRLTGGNSSMGRLEINIDGMWGSVCLRSFSMRDGHVACRQLGFRGVFSILNVNASWTSTANHTVLLTNINCQGYEDSLIHCDHEFGDNVCTYNEDVLLSCDDGEPEPDGRLRLVDGNNPSSGRLEILKNGLWGTVCSISFDKADADVACKQLGYNQSIQILENFGGGRQFPINLHEINCHGNESRLIDCEYEVYNHNYCHYSQNVAIVCDVPILTTGTAASGDIRLAGDGSTTMVGRLEMYWNGEWGTVCGRKFGMAEAHVACRQLGLGYAASYSFNQRHGWASGTINIKVKSCSGTEQHLFNCDHRMNPTTCAHIHDVNLVCTKWTSPLHNGRVRLTGGLTTSEGYIEVYAGNDSWYKICGSGFGQKEGNAACRQLGYDGIAASVYASFNGDDHMLVVNHSCGVNQANRFCLGSTDSCFHFANSTSDDCNPNGKAVYIKCEHRRDLDRTDDELIPMCQQPLNYDNDLRLDNGTASSGVLQIYVNRKWRNLCADHFTMTEGQISCRQLGFSTVERITTAQWSISDADSDPVTFDISQCSGFENKLSECMWTASDVSLTCTSGIIALQCSNRKSPFNSARLLGGAGPYGSLQWYNGSDWNGFCGTDNLYQTAQYYYRQLGFINISTLTSGPRCSSDEQHLQDCLANTDPQRYCKISTEPVIYGKVRTTEDTKEGSVILSSGNYTAGVLQVFYNNSWIDVWSSISIGHVACRQLGFYGALGVFSNFSVIGLSEGLRPSSGRMIMYNCTGTEGELNECSSFDVSENIRQSTIVVCNYADGKVDGRLRLTGGGETNGKLEFSLNGYWGTVCSETFNRAAADVACKELGFNESMDFIPRLNEGQLLPVFVYATNCTSNEQHLADCITTTSSFSGPCNYAVTITCNVYCRSPPVILHGAVSCSVGGDGVLSYQDMCDVSCDTGYTLTGSDTRTCLSNGSLSGTDGACKRKVCRPLPDIDNVMITCTKGDDGLLSYEDTCNVTCNTGYTLTGSDTRMCQSDGSWSGTDARCERVKCQSIAELNNGSITCTLGDDGVLSYEDTCSVTCNTGYTLTGSDTRMCQSDGSWSGTDGACKGVTTSPVVSSSDNTEAIVIAVMIVVIIILIAIVAAILVTYFMRKRCRKGKMHHVKFTNEKDDSSALYSSEGPTISLDDLTDVKPSQLAS